ncbi:MAG: hypothetical protein AAGK04_11445 [Planctomycetota bacterium]
MSGFPKTSDEINEGLGDGGSIGGDGGGLGLTGLNSAPKKAVNTQLVLAIGAVVVAGGLLYGMRRFGLDSGAALTDLIVDYPLESEVRRSEALRYERVIGELDRSARPYQISEDKLPVNPFSIPAAIVVEDPDTGKTIPVNPIGSKNLPTPEQLEARRIARIRDTVRSEYAKLSLQSVVGGRIPVAIIDGALVRVGDKVSESLTVERIGGRSVVLIDTLDERHTLTMKQKAIEGEMNLQKDDDDEG